MQYRLWNSVIIPDLQCPPGVWQPQKNIPAIFSQKFLPAALHKRDQNEGQKRLSWGVYLCLPLNLLLNRYQITLQLYFITPLLKTRKYKNFYLTIFQIIIFTAQFSNNLSVKYSNMTTQKFKIKLKHTFLKQKKMVCDH